ncbi:phosphoribosylaminoimidazolesuccinocarboxamide synthase [Candidatus Parcubacteria bacterium]|nr:phosphoribosylaminoimidazolesuccinocarboxamide synthase [Candidatus Parcubacteria bacterium]
MAKVLMESGLPFKMRRGKVRHTLDLGNGTMLIEATDRISAFDCEMPNGIPDKGKILTALSLFWFERMKDSGIQHHLITADVTKYPQQLQPYCDELWRRSMLVKQAEVIPFECVARGYLAGSFWKDYRDTGTVPGHKLPLGLRQCDKLPEPIFTPSTKAETGHDVNISFEEMDRRLRDLYQGRMLSFGIAEDLRDATLKLYREASEYAAGQGVILADTKFEFGLIQDIDRVYRLILIDEVLTPDSSRFWPANRYEPGRDQESFDKQFVRNYLENEFQQGRWNKESPAPELPPDIVSATRNRYIEAYEWLTGERWP